MSQGLQQSKNVIMVLGMAEAGVDALVAATKVFAANRIVANDSVRSIHHKLFSLLKCAPDTLQAPLIEAQAPERIGPLFLLAQEWLTKQFMSSSWLVLADVGTTKLLPFWRSVLKKMYLSQDYLIALRDPFLAARAYQKQTGCELEFALLYWSLQLLRAVEGTHGERRIVVSYDLLLRNPRQQLQRIRSTCQFAQWDELAASAYTEQFYNGKLSRYHPDFDELATNSAARAAGLCQSLYECLLRVAEDEITFDSVEFKSSWQAIMAEYAALSPMYAYLDRLLRKRTRLKRVLAEIRESWIWRLVAPLRYIDDRLRERRRNKHLKSRAVISHA